MYDWKKTLIKGLEIFVYAGIGGLISYFSGLEPTPTVTATIAVLKMIQNYVKHKE